jgi:hypothetical protein
LFLSRQESEERSSLEKTSLTATKQSRRRRRRRDERFFVFFKIGIKRENQIGKFFCVCNRTIDKKKKKKKKKRGFIC